MKNKFILFTLIGFLSFCFVIFYKGLNNTKIYKPKINNKKDIPVFRAKDFNSNIYIDSEKIFEKGNFYLVNIWSSWCVPCRDEHPFLMKLKEHQSVRLIGLNYRDKLNNAKNFINEFGNPYTKILIDSDGTLSVEFGAYGVPETFIINKDKKIIKKFIGPINEKIVEEIKLIIK